MASVRRLAEGARGEAISRHSADSVEVERFRKCPNKNKGKKDTRTQVYVAPALV